MNLLFFTDFKISPTKGGTEHTTLTVVKQLEQNHGCKCWACHFNDVEGGTPDMKCFEKQYKLSYKNTKEDLRSIILDNHIEVVLSEEGMQITVFAGEIRRENNLSFRNIFVHHFSPGWEVHFGNRIDFWDNVKKKHGLRKVKSFVKYLLYPYYKAKDKAEWPRLYKESYNSADDVVLLTKGYIPMFQEYGRFNDDKKFKIIPNALSLPDILDKKEYDNVKKKKVVVIARLEEIQKRISLVIKIWKEVSSDKRSDGWKLIIGGEGLYKPKYERYVSRHNVPRIDFLGRIDPVPYYRESSIFMMTSRSEGFPLTLNEALQYGVVPLAFDTFESVHDIIIDGKNGYIIPEMDIKKYSEKLLELMSNDILRKQMAMNGIDSCERYLPKRIGEMWWNLLNNKE